VIDVAVLRSAAERSSTLRRLLARHEQALHAQAQQSAACNASHSVEARLSRWLLRARDLHDGEKLPLTQESLARAIGVQRKRSRRSPMRCNRPASSATAAGRSKSGTGRLCERHRANAIRS